jgi:hypothetical protein
MAFVRKRAEYVGADAGLRSGDLDLEEMEHGLKAVDNLTSLPRAAKLRPEGEFPEDTRVMGRSILSYPFSIRELQPWSAEHRSRSLKLEASTLEL